MKKLYYILAALAGLLAIWFYFIPAFSGDINISSGIALGPLYLRWYGILMAGAILAAYLVARKYSWRFGISQKDIDDFTFWGVIFGIIGARVYYVLFNLQYFSYDWLEILKIWNGGLSIYGGILAGLLFGYLYTRKKAYGFGQLFDVIALGLPLGQVVGRLGNFFNQEAFGSPTSLPWKMFVEPQYRPIIHSQSTHFHPAFLYEIIGNLIIFFVLKYFIGKGKSGTIGWAYIGLYSLLRFFVEGIRVDSFIVNGLRVDQVVAVIFIVISGTMFLRRK